MNLPDVPIPAEAVMNEYAERLSSLTSANIRLTVMVSQVVAQRDNAMRSWEAMSQELQQWRQKYADDGNGLPVDNFAERRYPPTEVERVVT